MVNLPLNAFRKVLRENGAQRISSEALECFSQNSKKYVEEIAELARKYAKHAKRKTILASDVELAIREF